MTLRLALVTGRWRTGPIWGLAYAVAVGRAEDGDVIVSGSQIAQ
jgi:hypothetical protein